MLSRYLIYLVAFVAVAILIFIRAWDPMPVESLRHRQFDLFQNLKPRDKATLPIVIVDVDEESLAAFGQWPWPRTLLAGLVATLQKSGAVGIGFNFLFPEADRASPDKWVQTTPQLSKEIAEALKRMPSNDVIFARQIRRAPVVMGQSTTTREIAGEREEIARKASIVKVGGEPIGRLFGFLGITRNLPILENSAAGLGMVTLLPENDGVVRRPPLVIRVGPEIYPTMALEMLRVAFNETSLVLKSDGNGLTGIAIAGRVIPTDESGRIWFHYAPHDRARFVSAKEVLHGEVDADRLKGKLVLIGTSAAGFLDFKATPVDDAMASVEIQAQMLEAILSKAYLTRPDFVIIIEYGAIVLFGLLLLVRIPGLKPIFRFVSGVPVLAGVIGASWYLFDNAGILLDVTFPAISGIVLYILLVSIYYVKEEAQRREVRRAFGHYIAPELVEQLANDAKKLNLGGEIRKMSILFCDVRGFTNISEQLRGDPEKLTRLLNMYFTKMTDRILENGGTIDKYMGDAVMAFWNAPLDDPEHARHCCDAALEMLDGMAKLNIKLLEEAEREERIHVPMRVGIGLNTGDCLVGNFGSEHRLNYSVMGDAVNVASRLESQQKTYGITLIIGQETHDLVPEYGSLELDLIQVHGRVEPERIYGLLGRQDLADSADFKTHKKNHDGFLAAYRAQDWNRARELLRRCRESDRQGLDKLYEVFAARVESYSVNPVGIDWDGVHVAQTK
ncbi:MAG: adenylate/guanylate cyclase domain-containing protein [Proteobacteria bacterium]|nr:adenylate/guanylate cyclase domain-containing protein [Pseudomonadota bacterium]MDA1356271.1 adenylate/guanylate cyclase domain-containing protein [Pseudomonadota bacterium]